MIKKSVVMLGLLSSTLMAYDSDYLSISGIYTGGYTDLHPKNRTVQHNQFDYAANLSFWYLIRDDISGVFELQMGVGNSELGFASETVKLNDIFVNYAPEGKPYNLTFGSFGAPFGQFSDYLVNNADLSGTALILDPIGPVGAFNIVGLMTEYVHKSGEYIVAVTNGTDPSASNVDGRLSALIRYVSPLLNNTVTVGGGYHHSEDSGFGGSGLKVDYDASILDVHANLGVVSIKAYVAQLHFEDGNSGTNDRVMTSMIQISHELNDRLKLALRGSFWDPEDRTGDRFIGLLNPGFATAAKNTLKVDQHVARYEFGGTYAVNESVAIKGEIFIDDYSKQTSTDAVTDVPGALLYITLGF